MRVSMMKAVTLLCVVLAGAAACGEENTQTPDEPRVVTRTVVETVEAPEENEPTTQSSDTSDDPSEEAAPEETLDLQYQYINSGDYEGAYGLFTDDSKQAVSLEQYTAYFEATAPYQITDYSTPSVQVDGDSAYLDVALTVSTGTAGIQQYQRTQQMLLTDEGWEVVMRGEQIHSFTSATQTPAQAQPEDDSDSASGSGSESSDGSNVIVRVTGDEAFSGNYGTLESSRSVDGVAPAEYPVEVDTGFFSMDSVSVVMQKNGAGSGELGVEIVADGEVVRETSTTAEYGVVDANWSPAE